MTRRSLRALYFIAVCVVLISAAVLTSTVISRGRSVEFVTHTQQVMLQIEDVFNQVQDAETSQRGYLLTGEESYLAPYNDSVNRHEASLQRLAALVADSPAQQERVLQLDRLMAAKMGEMARTINLYRNGQRGQAHTVVLSDRGRQLMDQIRALLGEMRAEETRLLAVREAALNRRTERLYLIIALGTLLNLGLLISVAELNRRFQHSERSKSAAIFAREQRFRTTLASIGDAVITTDTEGVITFVNAVAAGLMLHPAEACVGRRINDIFPIFNEVTGAPAENPVERAIIAQRAVGLANHTVLKRHDGSMLPIEDSAAPIFDDTGAISGVVFVFRDVSRQRDMEQALRHTDRLAVAGRMAATVAHEINNPLEAVFNTIYIALHEPGTPDSVRGHLRVAEQELKRVAHITRQTLGFYRSDPRVHPFQVAQLLDDLYDVFLPRFTARNLTVTRDYGPDLEATGSMDDLKQVLSNLLTNAIDAVGYGGAITISAKPDANGAIQLVVQDNGLGIPANVMPRIFEPFFTTKQDYGTGLGLWVAQDLVEKHGGKLVVTSPVNDGKGARFTITLPAVSPLAEVAENAAGRAG